jgi:hypothetical protein
MFLYLDAHDLACLFQASENRYVLQVGIADGVTALLIHLLSNEKRHSQYDHAFLLGTTGVPVYDIPTSIITSVYSGAIKILNSI